MGPIRAISPSALLSTKANALRPITAGDFQQAMAVVKPSTDRAMLKGYEEFTREYGTAAG